MCQEKFFKVPKEMLVHGMKFVDQIISSHIPITGSFRHLVPTTPSHIHFIFLSLPFSLWLHLVINIIIFLAVNEAIFFGPTQEHLVTPDCVMARHPHCHLGCIVSFVTSSEGHLCKVNMKTFWRLSIVAIKDPM